MAAPNIVNATSILGKTAVANLTTTNPTTVLSNAASSNKVLKINSIIASNVDGTNNVGVTVALYDADDSAGAPGGTGTEIVSTTVVPADATLIVIDKNTPIYLEEDRSIGATAAGANDIKIICSYEEIS